MPLNLTISHHFPAPPDLVFETMNDPEQFQHWMKNFVRAEVTAGGSEFGVGTKISETRRFGGKDATEVFEVTHYDPPRAISLHVDSCQGSSCDFDMLYEPESGGTAVTMNGTIQGGNFFVRLMTRMMSGVFKRAMRKDFEALDEYIRSKQTA